MTITRYVCRLYLEKIIFLVCACEIFCLWASPAILGQGVACVSTHISSHAYTHTHKRTHTHTYTLHGTHTVVVTVPHTSIHTYTCIHMRTHTHTHTHHTYTFVITILSHSLMFTHKYTCKSQNIPAVFVQCQTSHRAPIPDV